MEKKKYIECFLGLQIYSWADWDIIDYNEYLLYNVQFCLPSMQKYNGTYIRRHSDGKMEICEDLDTEDNLDYIVWNGYMEDIEEIKDKLEQLKIDKDRDEKIQIEKYILKASMFEAFYFGKNVLGNKIKHHLLKNDGTPQENNN